MRKNIIYSEKTKQKTGGKRMKGRQNNISQRGITLIALVITIIILLILVAVTIQMAVDGKLFNYARKATKSSKGAILDEQALAEGRIQIDGIWYDSLEDYINNKPSSKQECSALLLLSYENCNTSDGNSIITVHTTPTDRRAYDELYLQLTNKSTEQVLLEANNYKYKTNRDSYVECKNMDDYIAWIAPGHDYAFSDVDGMLEYFGYDNLEQYVIDEPLVLPDRRIFRICRNVFKNIK